MGREGALMKDQRQPLSAKRVRDVISSSGDDVTRMYELKKGRPVDLAATRAMVEGLGCWQWRVAMGSAYGLGGATDGVEEAVRGLVSTLNHPESSVRSAAAESLAQLSAPTAALHLYEAYLTEDSHLTLLEIGKALLATSTGSLNVLHADRLQGLLERVLAVELTHLPLGGVPARRSSPPSLPAPGFFAKLFGSAPKPRPEPPPRVRSKEEREFLTPEGEQIEDFPDIVSQLAEIWVRLPGDREVRFELVLKLCRMPLSHFATTASLVRLAGELADSEERKARLVSEAEHWTIPSDPTRPNRLACGLARNRPGLRLELFRRFVKLGGPMDWTNWSHPLGKAGKVELEPLVAAAMEVPEGELADWLKLLKEAPVGLILPVLGRALHSPKEALVRSALVRLKSYGQPIVETLGDAEALKQRWSESPEILSTLESLIGQSARPAAGSVALPSGFREPVQVAEWTLPEMARNTFSQGERQPWTESLRGLKAFRCSGGELYLSTSESLVALTSGKVMLWPDGGHPLTLLAEGVKGELLFSGWGGSQLPLYLWGGGGVFQRMEPAIPDDEVPNGENLVSDGRNYGWAEAGVWKMSHFESDPGHHEDIAYRLDRSSGKLASVKASALSGMRPVEARKLATDEYRARAIEFAFSSDGAYRTCSAESLAIRAGAENPVMGAGRVSGRWALYLEVFPSRLCRVYVWERQAGKEDEEFSEVDAIEAMMEQLGRPK